MRLVICIVGLVWWLLRVFVFSIREMELSLCLGRHMARVDLG